MGGIEDVHFWQCIMSGYSLMWRGIGGFFMLRQILSWVMGQETRKEKRLCKIL